MRSLFLFICFAAIFASNPCTAIEIKGRVSKPNGAIVEYVSVGINGKNVGTVSDREGRFSLSVPDSLVEDKLLFSHISYDDKEVPIRDLLPEEHADLPVVVLEERSVAMQSVVVSNKKKRLKQLNSVGICIPKFAWGHSVPSTTKYKVKNERLRGVEFGTLFSLQQRAWIQKIEFDVESNSFDTLVFRIGIYNMAADSTLTPLMNTPYYASIDKAKDFLTYTCDLSDFSIYAAGQIYVCFEIVQDSDKGFLLFPFYTKSMYMRDISQGPLRKEIASFGLKVYGVPID